MKNIILFFVLLLLFFSCSSSEEKTEEVETKTVAVLTEKKAPFQSDGKRWNNEGLSKLAAYAKSKNINVIVENHGYLSSNAALLVAVMDGHVDFKTIFSKLTEYGCDH